MPSHLVKNGETVAIICTDRRGQRRCFYCGKTSRFLCDFPVKRLKDGKFRTCDKPLCGIHAKKGVSGETDFCREHYGLAKQAYERRQAELTSKG